MNLRSNYENALKEFQKYTDDILCVKNDSIVLINPVLEGVVFDEAKDDKYVFRNQEGDVYVVYGREHGERMMRNEGVCSDIIISEKETGEPIIDLVSEIVDRGRVLTSFEDCKEESETLELEEWSYIKMIRIISTDRKSVVEIIVPDKPLCEIINHRLI